MVREESYFHFTEIQSFLIRREVREEKPFSFESTSDFTSSSLRGMYPGRAVFSYLPTLMFFADV